MAGPAGRGLGALRAGVLVRAMLLVQVAVGMWRADAGLPPCAVGVRMVLAALTAAARTMSVLRLKRPGAEVSLP